MLSELYEFPYGQEYTTWVHVADKALFVAVDNEQIVGFTALSMRLPNRMAQVESIFVHPRYRRWGIGTRLIQTCLDFSRQQGIRAVFTQVTLADLGWTVYLKAGFRVSGFTDTYYAPRSTAPETALFLTCHLE